MKTHILFFAAAIAVMASCNETPDTTNDDAMAAIAVPRATGNLEASMPTVNNMNAPVAGTAVALSNMTPGPQHKELAAAQGVWATEMTYWDANGANPVTSKGTCEMKMVLGGRYQQAIYKATINGVPFEGIGYVAYDNAKKMYVNTWIDNMSTGILYLEGNYDPNSRTTEMIGKCHDPATCRQKGMRQVTHNYADGSQVMEMYETPDDGKEFKSMEIKFAKK